MTPPSDSSSEPQALEANDTSHAPNNLLFPLAASDTGPTSYPPRPIMDLDHLVPDTTSDDNYDSLSDSTYDIVSRSSIQASDSDNDTNDPLDTDNESLASFRAPTPSESDDSDEDQPDTPAADYGSGTLIPPPPSQEREESFEEERLRIQYAAEARAGSEVEEPSSSSTIGISDETQAEHELEIPSLDTSTIKASTTLSGELDEEENAYARRDFTGSQSLDGWIHFEETPDIAEGLVDITNSAGTQPVEELPTRVSEIRSIRAAMDKNTNAVDADNALQNDAPTPRPFANFLHETGAAARARLDEAQAALSIAARQCRDAINHVKQNAQRDIKREVQAWRDSAIKMRDDLINVRLPRSKFEYCIAGLGVLALIADVIVYARAYGLPPIFWSLLSILLTPLTLVASSIFSSQAAFISQPSTLAYNWTITSYSGNSISLHHGKPLNHHVTFNTTSIITGSYHALTFDPTNDVAYAQVEGARTKVERRGPYDLEISLPFGRCDDVDLAIDPVTDSRRYTRTLLELRNRCSGTRFDGQLKDTVKGGLTRLAALQTSFSEFGDRQRMSLAEMLPSKQELRHSMDRAIRNFQHNVRKDAQKLHTSFETVKSLAQQSADKHLRRCQVRFGTYVRNIHWIDNTVSIEAPTATLRDLRRKVFAHLHPHAHNYQHRKSQNTMTMKQRREVRAETIKAIKQRLADWLGFRSARSLPLFSTRLPPPKQNILKARRRAVALRDRLWAWYVGETVDVDGVQGGGQKPQSERFDGCDEHAQDRLEVTATPESAPESAEEKKAENAKTKEKTDDEAAHKAEVRESMYWTERYEEQKKLDRPIAIAYQRVQERRMGGTSDNVDTEGWDEDEIQRYVRILEEDEVRRKRFDKAKAEAQKRLAARRSGGA